ncbi:MAG: ATP-binding protein [Prevotella sp.]|nr:ATP-binding protein [Prevotella sp.]
MFEVSRAEYIERLKSRRHNGMVKIITGVRRCGKSYLLFNLFRRFLLEDGIAEDHIIALQLDDFKNEEYHDRQKLYQYVTERIKDEGEYYYVLLDEIQMVEGFEGALNGFMHIRNADVYVTGSNSRFLSSDIITEFRGRGDEIRVYPFSFAEFYSIDGGDKREALTKYCRYGGMPQSLSYDTPLDKEDYLKGLFNKVYKTDIINRYSLRCHDEIDVLTNVLSSSIGALTNPKRISDTFKSERNLTVSQSTISKYLDYLEDSFLVSKALRYDVKGRKYISTPMKYFFVDVGLRNALLNFRQLEENHIMENIVYNELLRRGFSVDVGVVNVSRNDGNGKVVRKQLEVDFVANMGSSRYYIQSAYGIATPEKVEQEKGSLVNIRDSFKKIIIEHDYVIPWHDDDGILRIGILDFLMNEKSIDW